MHMHEKKKKREQRGHSSARCRPCTREKAKGPIESGTGLVSERPSVDCRAHRSQPTQSASQSGSRLSRLQYNLFTNHCTVLSLQLDATYTIQSIDGF